MSSDTRDHDGMIDDDSTRPAEKATVPPPHSLFDDEVYGDDEATVMARIPDELIAESQRAEEVQGGGLKQMFSREGAHAPRPRRRPRRSRWATRRLPTRPRATRSSTCSSTTRATRSARPRGRPPLTMGETPKTPGGARDATAEARRGRQPPGRGGDAEAPAPHARGPAAPSVRHPAAAHALGRGGHGGR